MSPELVSLLLVLTAATVWMGALGVRRWAVCHVLGHRVGTGTSVRGEHVVVRSSACTRCGRRYHGERPLGPR